MDGGEDTAMGTPYAHYPYERLQAVGTSLGMISDQVGSRSRGAAEVEGLTADQDRINAALGAFRDEWHESVKKLGESIRQFGILSGQIGAMAGGLDQALAAAMRVGGAATPGGRGGPAWSAR